MIDLNLRICNRAFRMGEKYLKIHALKDSIACCTLHKTLQSQQGEVPEKAKNGTEQNLKLQLYWQF